MSLAFKLRPAPMQVEGSEPEVLAEVLRDGVNLAVWQRELPASVQDFAAFLLQRQRPLAESFSVRIEEGEGRLTLPEILPQLHTAPGYEAFVADLLWQVEAFACLLDARSVGVRLRILDKPMCPRFHVDHVPVRLITTYAGVASEWLAEGAMPRHQLGQAAAEPTDEQKIRRLQAGHVALAKGEKWLGNEGAGLIHRSPQPPEGQQRLLLTLDWLG